MADENTIIPGAFYWSEQPGGWADTATGIHIPGPIVTLDKVSRKVTGVDSMPAPVQIWTHKISYSLTNPKEQVECEFDRHDSEALCEGLNLAIQTGNIKVCPNKVVEELYPKAWKARKDKLVFKRDTITSDRKPLADMVDEFLQSRRVKLKAGKTADELDTEFEQQREDERKARVRHQLENSDSSLAPSTVTNDLNVEPTAPQPPLPPTPPGA